jgi:hypothetical protein
LNRNRRRAFTVVSRETRERALSLRSFPIDYRFPIVDKYRDSSRGIIVVVVFSSTTSCSFSRRFALIPKHLSRVGGTSTLPAKHNVA